MLLKVLSTLKAALFFLLLVSNSISLQAQVLTAANDLVVAIPYNYPPYFFVDETRQPRGFGIDVFEAVAARAGIQYRYQLLDNWKQVCEALKKGTADIVPLLNMNADVEAFTLLTSPVETFPVSIFVRSSNNFIHSKKDLVPFQVAIVKDNCGGLSFYNGTTLNLQQHEDFDRAFQALISGQVDAMIYPYTGMQNRVRRYELSDKIRAIEPPLTEVKNAFAVRLNAPQLRDQLELSLQSLLNSEQYNQIYRMWFVVEKDFWDAKTVFWFMNGVIVFVIITFMILRHREILLINASLQQQINDATQQLSQSNEYLRDLTVTDTLTGISNRRAFESNLEELMGQASRYKSTFSMLIFDIDNFKRLNDQYGHDMGDRVLKDLVERIKEVVRDVDILSRWGGEEFTILMVQTNREGALRMAERCRRIVADTLFDEVGPVTISLGVTCYKPGDNERMFFKRADDALYQAKAEGKNRVVWIG